MWTPGEVRCEGSTIAPVQTLRRPYNGLVYPRAMPSEPVMLRFAIDATGRVYSIARESQGGSYQSDDIAPALASSRFAPGRAFQGCTVTYSSSIIPLANAPVAELLSYSMNQQSGPLPREGWRRIESGANCFSQPRPQPVLRAYPDFSTVKATPGVRDWSLVRFDTDADGRAVRPIVVTGTGNRNLDEASIAAVADSRFTGGARSGCLYPYWRAPAALRAQPMPDKPYEPARCARKDGWQTAPVLSYPPAYQRRAIEGWAVVRYDIAPWGATGNVSVIEAQPSADFGVQAKRMIEAAKARPSDTGASNCVVHVRYAIPVDAPQAVEAPAGVAY